MLAETYPVEKIAGEHDDLCGGGYSPVMAIGIKHDAQKLRMSLLPKSTLREVVDVLEFGAGKYANDNWQKVPQPRTRYYDACMRHIQAWWEGQKLDSESGRYHLAHAVCCLLFLLWFDALGEK